MKKVLNSNVTFFLGLALLVFIGVNSEARALVLRALIKTGLYEPDVSDLKPKPVTLAGAAPLNNPMPSLLFNDVDGKAVSISDLKGKVIFLNFWATWCPPCIAEMPSINTLYRKVKSNTNIVFLMVDVDGNARRSEKFMKKKGFELPVHTPASNIPENVFTGTIPTTLIIDKEGSIVFNQQNMADYSSEKVENFLLQLAL